MARTEDLFKEVIENSRKDREKLEHIRDRILSAVDSTDPDTLKVMEIEPLAMLGVAENIARISDVLVKVNSQLVELAKISVKIDNPVKELNSDRESMFDEIEKANSDSDDTVPN